VSDPYRRLAAAVLLQGARDAAENDDPGLAAPARRWLADDGMVLAELLDIPLERVAGWLERQPTLDHEQLPLFDG
jgi:hypothetical protein